VKKIDEPKKRPAVGSTAAGHAGAKGVLCATDDDSGRIRYGCL